MRYRLAIAHCHLRRQLHLALVGLERLLTMRREAVPLLRRRKMGMVLRQRLRLDQRLRRLRSVQLSRVLGAA